MIMKKYSPTIHDSNKVYEKHVKPLEEKHKGEFAGVSYSGKVVLAPTLLEAMEQSVASFGKRNSFIFKVGDKVVGKLL